MEIIERSRIMGAEKKTNEIADNLYFIKLTIDLAFKYIFGEPKNIDLLKSLLTDIMKLPIGRLEGLGFMGEELHRDSLTDRKTIVDVRAVLTDKTWDYIRQSWLPESKYNHTGGYQFETYIEDSRTFSEDIYIPIKQK